LQTPTYPEYSIEPRRLYNVSVFAILAIFITLILHMLQAIIHDHRD
jgi:capsular polysaccharide transport system permease protein